MEEAGQWHADQLLGRRWSIGCVALEVTQRCNLDCTLCYLSDMSEAVHDVPLPELFRRIDAIAATYGPGTGVQVTGGDPTLRRPVDLVAIVAHLRERGLRPTLMTNGIKASRSLLAMLAEAGLRDVAFHVDTTQRRPGFGTESALNAIRQDYINRARGLPLTVFFNTTVHAGNFREIPNLVRFFVAHGGAISVASFQLQADTGRGVAGGRATCITRDTVAAKIAEGLRTPVRFLSGIGHHACNAYAATLVAAGHAHCITDDAVLTAHALSATAAQPFDHTPMLRRAGRLLRWGLKHPDFLRRGGAWALRTLWRMRRDLLTSGGQVHRLGFFIHDFMDACHLEPDRVAACAFMVATAEGPVSMCLHNARRDSFITQSFQLEGQSETRLWDPLTGTVGPRRHIPPKGRRKRSRVGQANER
jgi:molybdenum cofactor biosynthesis enzyme MoaA